MRKVYGSYRKSSCPYCGADAMSKNEIGLSVCKNHIKTDSLDIKCSCGSWLDVKEGKFGTFFLCENCGPIGMGKAMELKSNMPEQKVEVKLDAHTENKEIQKADFSKNDGVKKEIFITSDDVEYFD